MTRVLAVDWGERRVGLALSDPLGITAQGLPTEEVSGSESALETIAATVAHHGVVRVVIGLPLRLDGSAGPEAQRVRAFADRLAGRAGIPVETWDERLTSVQAERSLRESGAKAGRRGGGGRRRTRPDADRKARVDARAAVLLLQSWLDAHPGRSTQT